MADKKKLTTSFGTSRKRKKPSLDEINKIAEATASPTPASSTPPVPTESRTAAPKKPAAKKPATQRKASAPKRPATTPPTEPQPVAMKKTSVDLPLELYQEIKIHLIKNQIKFREYLTDLIENDLKKHRK